MGIVATIVLVILGLIALNSAWGLIEFVFALVIWALAGYLAGQVTRGRGYGVFGNVLMGLIGGVVGSFALHILGLSGLIHLPLIGAIITGAFGAILVVVVVNLVSKK
jgi:uncharacterized membrane protein YeaQ/YmgE (transglycosylase-associated protein family)